MLAHLHIIAFHFDFFFSKWSVHDWQTGRKSGLTLCSRPKYPYRLLGLFPHVNVVIYNIAIYKTLYNTWALLNYTAVWWIILQVILKKKNQSQRIKRVEASRPSLKPRALPCIQCRCRSKREEVCELLIELNDSLRSVMNKKRTFIRKAAAESKRERTKKDKRIAVNKT